MFFFLLFTFANGLGKTHKSIFSRKAAFGSFLHTPNLPSPKQPCIYQIDFWRQKLQLRLILRFLSSKGDA